jgi:RNA polymerase sigma factor (sigma-70 family)
MTDGQLLECFISRRDEAAFEALVRRHASMVFGVCRRILHSFEDAEDAFQATFLVLVRRAASIGQRELLGNWLYGVAYRTALDARKATSRRRTRERQVNPMPEPETASRADAGHDLRPLLDQELNRLPNKYRVPVILCDLEGRTRRDVARQLGIPVGTLSGQLTSARRLLARRLARRGVSLAGGALGAAVWQGAASASVPAPLVASTLKAVSSVAAGCAATPAVSAKAAALAEGVVRAMFLTKLRIVTAVLLLLGIVAGAGLLAHQPAQLPAAPSSAKAPANKADTEVPKPKVLKLGSRGRRVVWSPDGKTLLVVTKNETMVSRKGSAIKLWDVSKGQVGQTLAEDKGGGLAFQQVAYSADGKRIAATVAEEVKLPGGVRQIRMVVKVWDAKTLALKQTLGDNDSYLVSLALSPDGKQVAACDPGKKTIRLWNAETGKPERTLKTGEVQVFALAYSPDSKTLVAGGQKGKRTGVITLWDARKGELQRTIEQTGFVVALAISPDGKLIASSTGGETVQVWNVEKGELIVAINGNQRVPRSLAFLHHSKILAVGGRDGKVRLWDVPSGELRQTLEGHGDEVHAIACSPDGKTLASVSQDETLRLWPINPRPAKPK